MLTESLAITAREQTEVGKKFCYGCGQVGHLRRDCPTNSWDNKKRTRTGHTGETPVGKVAKVLRVFDKPEYGPEEFKLVLFPTEGEVTEERHESFKEQFDDWIVGRVEEADAGEEAVLDQIPEIDKNRRYHDRIELSVPTFRDLQKLRDILAEVGEIGFKVLTPDEYQQTKEKLTRFTGVIPVDPSKVTLAKLNMFVKIHRKVRKIEGKLEITRCYRKCQRGGVYELMANDKALERWTDHYIHLGSSGKIQFTRREKSRGDLRAEAEKLDSEESRLSQQLEKVRAKKDKITIDIAADEAEGELLEINLGEGSQGGKPGATGNEAEAVAPGVGAVKVETESDVEFPSLPPPGEVHMSSPQKCDLITPQAGVLGGSQSAERPCKGTLPEGPKE